MSWFYFHLALDCWYIPMLLNILWNFYFFVVPIQWTRFIQLTIVGHMVCFQLVTVAMLWRTSMNINLHTHTRFYLKKITRNGINWLPLELWCVFKIFLQGGYIAIACENSFHYTPTTLGIMLKKILSVFIWLLMSLSIFNILLSRHRIYENCVYGTYCFHHRSKRAKILLELNRQKEEEDHRLQLQLQRQRAMRLSRELRLSMLEIVHPGG